MKLIEGISITILLCLVSYGVSLTYSRIGNINNQLKKISNQLENNGKFVLKYEQAGQNFIDSISEFDVVRMKLMLECSLKKHTTITSDLNEKFMNSRTALKTAS